MKTTQPCGRCGGTGRHSFNLRDGTVCYGCGGSGKVPVDLAAKARRAATKATADAKDQEGRGRHIAAMKAVRERLNASHGFDLTTTLGLDQLNAAAFRETGKDLMAHCKAELDARHGSGTI